MNPHPIPEHLDSLHPPLLSEGEASPEPQPPQQHCFPAFGQNIWRLVGVAERIERPEDLTKKGRIGQGRNGEEVKLERDPPTPSPSLNNIKPDINERSNPEREVRGQEVVKSEVVSESEVRIKTECQSDDEMGEEGTSVNGEMEDEEMAVDRKEEEEERFKGSNHVMDDSDMSSDSEVRDKAKDDYWSDESDGPENLSSKSLPLLPVVKVNTVRAETLIFEEFETSGFEPSRSRDFEI
jgi:hypothetical protein